MGWGVSLGRTRAGCRGRGECGGQRLILGGAFGGVYRVPVGAVRGEDVGWVG